MDKRIIQSFFTYIQSQHTAQQFLKACYESKQIEQAALKSYENCQSFLYFLEHGQHFYESGQRANMVIQPIFYFYGLVHLLKACILTVRPHYPESTKILAHGVSARKRKRKDYTFLNDDVKIQQSGLFPYAYKHLFSFQSILHDRMKMSYLMSLIPELLPLFEFQQTEKLIKVGHRYSRHLIFPEHILDHYFISATTFINKLKTYLPDIQQTEISKQTIKIKLAQRLTFPEGPFFYHTETNAIYFPTDRDHCLPISEVMIHYLILYNLSMVSRYETGWWGDLLATKQDQDFPFIREFLNVTATKMPLYLGQLLYQTYLNVLPIH